MRSEFATQKIAGLAHPTGNWNGFTSIAEGTPLDGLVQNRTANTANEVTAIGATVGDIWETPAHDRNGNMTTMPKPSALTDGYNAKYDAWNRLVKISETGGATVATYEYDGLNRRTLKVVSGTTTHISLDRPTSSGLG
ncbi:MAG: RHS repeat protein [Planctomycetes bacterium]|nr:RHS repeat protein [Planctomycetota bacterium]